EQRRQQDQDDGQPLQGPYLRLDTLLLAAYQRFEGGQGQAQVVAACLASLAELLALADQRMGAVQFRRITLCQAVQLALQGDATVRPVDLRRFALQTQQGGEGAARRGAILQHAQQWQSADGVVGQRQLVQRLAHLGEQTAPVAGGQLAAQQSQALQLQGGVKQAGRV